MKRPWTRVTARALFVGFALAFAAPGAPDPAPRESQEAEKLKSVERSWNEAIIKKDVQLLDRILSDQFVLVWVDGSISSKAELLAAVARRKTDIDPFLTEDVKVRLFGDTAILTGRFTQTVHLGERSETNSFRYTDVYWKTRAGWQAVSAHATLIRPPKLAA